MTRIVVLRVGGKLLLPYILLLALYTQFHGDFGPGGGFQAGVIFAAGLMLYGLVAGPRELERVAPRRVLEVLFACGVLIYGGTGVAGLLLGGNYLNYNVLDAHDPAHGQHLGLMLIELGVGLGVCAGMTTIFLHFAGRREPSHHG